MRQKERVFAFQADGGWRGKNEEAASRGFQESPKPFYKFFLRKLVLWGTRGCLRQIQSRKIAAYELEFSFEYAYKKCIHAQIFIYLCGRECVP
jgi:hypothetical protein